MIIKRENKFYSTKPYTVKDLGEVEVDFDYKLSEAIDDGLSAGLMIAVIMSLISLGIGIII